MKAEVWNSRPAIEHAPPNRGNVVNAEAKRTEVVEFVHVVTLDFQGVKAEIAFNAETRQLIAGGYCSPEAIDRAWWFLYGDQVEGRTP